VRRILWCIIILSAVLLLAACKISAGPIDITINNPISQIGLTSTTTGTTGSSSTASVSSPTNSPTSKLAQQLLQQINQDRASYHLPAYQWEPRLERSAYKHDLVMAGGCGLNHICPNEPQLGTRESDQGVQWNYAGENIGTGGPVQSSYASQWNMVLLMHHSMMGEKPPDDGHRQNLLSKNFHRVGISIYIDKKNMLWLTEDFAN
jgi:uncharacterized protein YkwD